jgi:glycosyltransferase involved in cell wall biosynthesis
MRIVYIITRMDELGGPQIHLRDLAARLKPYGHDIHVVSGTAGDLTDFLTHHSLATCHIIPGITRAISPWREPLALYYLYTLLRQIRPDLVSCHSSKAGVLGRMAAFLAGCKCIFTVHGWAFTENVPGVRRFLYRVIETMMSPFCARILTVSEYDRQLGIRARIAAPHKLVTVHNGMPDVAEFTQINHVGSCRLVMVARFAEQKDHRLLVDALAMLKHLSWTIELIGNGDTSVITQQVQSLGLQDRVHILGQRSDVKDRLAAANVFLLITHWEGFPRSIIEAMRASLPVIATDVAGVSEAVVDGETGFLVPHGDRDALVQALTTCVQNKNRCAAMGHAGRMRYEQAFTFEHMFQKTAEVYTAVTGLPIYPEPVDNHVKTYAAA